jgi:cytochrome c556
MMTKLLRTNNRQPNRTSLRKLILLTCAGLLIMGPALSIHSEESADGDAAVKAAPSTYCAAADLERQVGMLHESLASELATSDEYTEAKQTRISRAANTLIVVAQLLGLHDQPSKYKAAAPTLVAQSRALSAAASDYDKAKAAFDQLEASIKDPQPSSDTLAWEPVADIKVLMEHVPNLNSRLRRGLTKSRFEKTADETTAYAAAMAAVAQASALDMTYCSGAEDEAAWTAMCVEFRSAMADLSKATRAADFDAAKDAMTRSSKSCETCHEKFKQ